MEKPERSTLDFGRVPHIAGVPRYLFRSALVAMKDTVVAALRGDSVSSFDRELWLCAFAGIVKQRWKDRHRPIGTKAGAGAPVAAATPPRTASSA
jgi:hypothetical protein